jgi:ribosomal protein S18 acetylase RimI-like enzyme
VNGAASPIIVIRLPLAIAPQTAAGLDMPLQLSSIDIRPAIVADIPELLAIETRSFSTDRLSPRAFRHLLTRAQADCLLAQSVGAILGYAAVFYRAASDVARLHSLAVDPAARGRGVAALILAAIEDAARKHGAAKLRLAVRTDNAAGVMLYRSRGYRELGTELAYYTDGMSALTMEKVLAVA